MLLCLLNLLLRLRGLDGSGRRNPFEIYAEVILQLLYVAALLPRLKALRAAVVHKPHMLRALYHAVEIIRPHGILELICRKAEALSELRRNEGGAHAVPWEHPLIGAQHHKVPEIQRTGFQGAHYLKSAQGLSLERDGYSLQKPPDNPHVGDGQDLKVRAPQDIELGYAALCEVHLQHHAGIPGQRAPDIPHNFREIILQRVILGGRCK